MMSAPFSYANLRPMTERDLDTVVEIERQSQLVPWRLASFASAINAQDVMPVAEHMGKVIGFAILKSANDEAELLNLAVAPAHRERGVARALAQFLWLEAKARGVATVFLEVRASNTVAQALYKAEGFYLVGQRKNYYSTDTGARENALLLRRDL